MSLARLAETVTPTQRVALKIEPTSSRSLNCHIKFLEEPQRQRLQLSARKTQAPTKDDMMGDGGKQWNSLNVSVERKKRRCAECTRPLPEHANTQSLLCERCAASSASSSQLEVTAAASSKPTKATVPKGKSTSSVAKAHLPAATTQPPQASMAAAPPSEPEPSAAVAAPKPETSASVTWAIGARDLVIGACVIIVGLSLAWRFKRRNRA